MNKLTVVMYHYVRPLKGSRFPDLKGLEFDLFVEQIKYLKKHYTPVTMEEVLQALENKLTLPEKPVLLTFDDAYIDHFTYVYPFLRKNEMQGSFFAPVQAVTESKILDVNQIHHILASTGGEVKSLIIDIKKLIEDHREEHSLSSFDHYYNKLAQPNRFDCKDTIFFKRLLQAELDESVRSKFTAMLFEKHIGLSQGSFAKELYMTQGQIEHMIADGMHFGSHGHNHYWWDKLNSEQLHIEVKKSTDFLIECGAPSDTLTACYPYGAYNQEAMDKLSQFKYKAAFTSKVNIADLSTVGQFEIPRLDTNDVPKSSTSPPNKWHAQG